MTCKRCAALRLAWYFSPEVLKQQALEELQAHLRTCAVHQQRMSWAKAGPPNPELSIEEMEEMK